MVQVLKTKIFLFYFLAYVKIGVIYSHINMVIVFHGRATS
jgi:hypothetical protein